MAGARDWQNWLSADDGEYRFPIRVGERREGREGKVQSSFEHNCGFVPTAVPHALLKLGAQEEDLIFQQGDAILANLLRGCLALGQMLVGVVRSCLETIVLMKYHRHADREGLEGISGEPRGPKERARWLIQREKCC